MCSSMADSSNTTFGNLEIDERFKKLERSLKLALLKKQYEKNRNTGEVSPMKNWPSISTINVDTLDSSCMTPSQNSFIKSEILTSSNNLRNILLKKKSHNVNRQVMATSSVKQYDVRQNNHIDRLVMPPPKGNIVYRVCKETQNRTYSPLNHEKTPSLLHNSIQPFPVNTSSLKSTPSCISITDTNEEYLHTFVTPKTPINHPEKVDRIFSKWRIMLNDQYELIIKGTLECGRLARSKPIIRRYTTTCVESKYKHKYSLEGTIVDERNVLPDYIRGKFYNGFPDDWENVYQVWRTYIDQGSPVMFHWPTPITDSDDDLKSEITDLTYACTRNNKIIPSKECYDLAEHTKISENSNNESSKKMNIFQEDKLNIIMNNLADKNCSQKYIDKIIEMFDCMDYLVSYKSVSEYNDSVISANSATPISIPPQQNFMPDDNCDDSDKSESEIYAGVPKISFERIMKATGTPKDIYRRKVRKKNYSNAHKYAMNSQCMANRIENKCESVQAAIPIIDIEENVLNESCISFTDDEARVTNANRYHKTINVEKPQETTVSTCQEIQRNNFDVHRRKKLPIIDIEKRKGNLHSNESCVSYTEDEARVTNTNQRHKTINVEKPQKTTFSNHQEIQRNNFDVHGEKLSIIDIEKRKENLHSNESCISFTEDEARVTNTNQRHKTINVEKPQETTFSDHQRIQRNNFDVRGKKKLPIIDIKKKKENLHSNESCVSITDDEIEVINPRKRDKTTNIIHKPQKITSFNHKEIKKNNCDMLGGNRPATRVRNEPPDVSKIPNFPAKNETATQKLKPTVISSMSVNLNIKRIDRSDTASMSKHQRNSTANITENNNKQCASIRPREETLEGDKRRSVQEITVSNQCPTATIPMVIDSKTTTDSKKEAHPITNNKNKLNTDCTNSTKSMMNPEQSKSDKLGVKDSPRMLTAWMPKVIYRTKSKSESGLNFEGKLLNEADHVINRKFTTDIVLRRLSPRLIETVNHEYYKLVGNLNDNKHTLPKELAMQCRNGCPANIEQFCLTWRKLQRGQVQIVEKKHHNTSMEALNTPISSRGRRILPPLCYWEGERITLKDNIPIYSQGNSHESSLPSFSENSKEQLDIEEENKRKESSKSTSAKKQNENKQKLLFQSNEISGINKNQTFNISPKTKAAGNSKVYRKSAVNCKQQMTQLKQLFSASDSNEEEQKTVAPNHTYKSQSVTRIDAKDSSGYMLRKRQKIEVPSNRIAHGNVTKHSTTYRSPRRKTDMTYAYFQTAPLSKDFLSEDEQSAI